MCVYDKVLRRATRSVYRRATLVGERTAGSRKTATQAATGRQVRVQAATGRQVRVQAATGRQVRVQAATGRESSSPRRRMH